MREDMIKILASIRRVKLEVDRLSKTINYESMFLAFQRFFSSMRPSLQGIILNEGHFPRSLKVDDRDMDRDSCKDDRERERENREQDRVSSIGRKYKAGNKMTQFSSKDKYMAKPIQELNLSNCECFTPSHQLLPKNVGVSGLHQHL